MTDKTVYGSRLRAMSRAVYVKETFMVLGENLTNPLTWSLLLNLDTIPLTHRIRKYVLDGDSKEAWRLKESYKDTFAMEAVAAAITAQIAITMPGLPDFGTIHWTATAFAYTSLVSGLLSTFFSFYVQQILSDLHSPEDVREWLTSPRRSLDNYFVNIVCQRLRIIAGEPANRGDRIPSLTAAATLTAPGRLLSLSIVMLFVALGIYLGSVWTAKLGALKGSNANLAVLLFFIIFAAYSLGEVFLPLRTKLLEQNAALLVRDREEPGLQSVGPRNDMANTGATTEAARSGNTSETEVVIRQALQASFSAQEESLKSQKALLQLLL
ncbi:hypothetical protein GJ744_008931 [Endocarpon pusillum]|uniref:Uncharacterized protein n=1 Tax=Endocarpon pusillum TaxID=364733 RepID=A0A8H7AVD9_9EURO|nr:hypothetical protein GJ744_008931 [Endocarpon pusillum]